MFKVCQLFVVISYLGLEPKSTGNDLDKVFLIFAVLLLQEDFVLVVMLFPHVLQTTPCHTVILENKFFIAYIKSTEFDALTDDLFFIHFFFEGQAKIFNPFEANIHFG